MQTPALQATASGPQHELQRRATLAAVVLVIESLLVGSLPHPWFHPQQIMAAPVALGAAFLLLMWHNRRLAGVDAGAVLWVFVWLHGFALLGLAAATFVLLRGSAATSANTFCIGLWYGSIAALVLTLAMALFRLRPLTRALLSLRVEWLYLAFATVAAMSARAFVRWAWNAPDSRLGHVLQTATFASVKALLSVFYAQVITRPGTMILGTPKFHVQIAGTCSGIEGLTLMLLFSVCWLVFARRELRLVRALLLVPAALVLSWVLNTVRIAALIALGDAGHAELAVNGFHSEAGWILFNLVAIVFLLSVQQLAWLRKDADSRASALMAERNVAAPYLLPFLAVLATAMLTHAVSARFDWLYPLRFVVGVSVLVYFRAEYRKLDWRFGWLGVSAGVFVFGVWLAVDHLQPQSVSLLRTSLQALPAEQRMLWIMARVLAAIITVPMAEELAFRGYLARRTVSADVEAIPFAQLTLLSIAGSALAFGLMHGRMGIAGVIAGVVFALVAKWRNRIGEAVAAHATANMLVAIWVLMRGDYRFL